MPVKLYCGNDEYSINLELKKIRKTVLNKDFAELNRRVITEKLPKIIDLRELIETIETTPMMFGNLLIEVNCTSLFVRCKADNDKLLDNLISDIKSLPDNVYIVFVCIFPANEDKKIDSAKKIVKTIKEVGEIHELNGFKFFETSKVVDWILKKAKEKEITLSAENAISLQSFVGSDLRTLDSELEKIKTYILPSVEVKNEDIINLSQDNEDAFKILDLWLKGDKYNLLYELNKLVTKDAPQKVIALFQTTIKRWLRIKLEAEYSNSQDIAKIIGAHPFFVQNEMTKLAKIDKDKLLSLRKTLNKAEYMMKSGVVKPELALEMALVQ